MDDISTLLRDIKAATALTETQLAAELGTTQPTVNRILNGQPGCRLVVYRAIVAMYVAKCGPAKGSTSPPPEDLPLTLSS